MIWRVLVAGLLVFGLALPAVAHTTEEQEAWLEAWSSHDYSALGVDPWWFPEGDAAEAIREDIWLGYLIDMQDRHPCSRVLGTWTSVCEPRSPVHSASPSESGSPEAAVPTRPSPEDRGYGEGVEQWRPLVASLFPESQVATAMCIMEAESRGDPTAVNDSSGAAGLFQFLPSTWRDMVPDSITGGSMDSVFDPATNITGAAWLQDAIGWSQWSPWKRGECR